MGAILGILRWRLSSPDLTHPRSPAGVEMRVRGRSFFATSRAIPGAPTCETSEGEDLDAGAGWIHEEAPLLFDSWVRMADSVVIMTEDGDREEDDELDGLNMAL